MQSSLEVVEQIMEKVRKSDPEYQKFSETEYRKRVLLIAYIASLIGSVSLAGITELSKVYILELYLAILLSTGGLGVSSINYLYYLYKNEPKDLDN